MKLSPRATAAVGGAAEAVGTATAVERVAAVTARAIAAAVRRNADIGIPIRS